MQVRNLPLTTIHSRHQFSECFSFYEVLTSEQDIAARLSITECTRSDCRKANALGNANCMLDFRYICRGLQKECDHRSK